MSSPIKIFILQLLDCLGRAMLWLRCMLSIRYSYDQENHKYLAINNLGLAGALFHSLLFLLRCSFLECPLCIHRGPEFLCQSCYYSLSLCSASLVCSHGLLGNVSMEEQAFPIVLQSVRIPDNWYTSDAESWFDQGEGMCVSPRKDQEKLSQCGLLSVNVVFFFSCTSASVYWFELCHVKWLLSCVN